MLEDYLAEGKRASRSVFLRADELAVFQEHGVPVRFIKPWKKTLGTVCSVCNAPAETAAHRIPYKLGILKYGLLPSFLNQWVNLIATCRRCNKSVELDAAKTAQIVAALHDSYVINAPTLEVP